MTTQSQNDSGSSRLWRKPRRWWLLGIPAGGFAMFVIGIIFWGGFNMFMEHTNTLEFCISCHEMQDTVYQEYKETVHYKNSSGSQAMGTQAITQDIRFKRVASHHARHCGHSGKV